MNYDSEIETEERIAAFGYALPSVRRQNWVDVWVLGLVVGLGTLAIVGALLGLPPAVELGAVMGLVIVSFAGAYQRMMARPDHVRALQSDRMLKIANESIAFLRYGLDSDTAAEVCRIVLHDSEAAAVAITDCDTVLGFAGLGQDHHLVGGPIITRATHESLDANEPRILYSKEDIGCPERTCRLRAAIVVPLEKRGHAVGTLKFYYTSDRYLNETQLAMAEGLGRLLSTQLELSELERQTELAREAELKALQAQINPHFLFNTINTIAAFIRTDPAEARRLLRQFGVFYRRMLEHSDDLITLGRELEHVETYLELEQARFGERLCFVVDAQPGTAELPMPAFMLQPLVENSVQHAMPSDGSGLTITVTSVVSGGQWTIEVRDDGDGIPAERLPHVFDPGVGEGLGIALPNVRDRVVGFYGPDSRLEIDSIEGDGTVARIVVTPVPGRELHVG